MEKETNTASYVGEGKEAAPQVKVEIKVKGSELRNINDLDDFQGDLKTLSDANYKKLRREILDLGFCEPLVVWGKNILNGHQRVKTLKKMAKEGIVIPNIPVNVVQAKSLKEAKKMVLSLTSQFGKMTEESLMKYMKESDLELEEVIGGFEFAGLDLDTLSNMFGNEKMDLEFEDIEDDGSLPDIDLEGEIPNKTDYIILTFDDGEKIEDILAAIGVNNNIKRISYKNFMDAMMGRGEENVPQ